MKIKNNHTVGFLLIVFSIAFLSGCSGLPDNLMHEFKLMPKRLMDSEALINTKKDDFNKLSSHSEWDFFSPYLESEKWIDKFTLAHDELNQAKKLFDSQIAPMADRNEPEETSAFSKLVDEFNMHLLASMASAKHAYTRINFLVTVRNTADEKYQTASKQYENIRSLHKRFTKKAKKAIVDYPDKKEDLVKRIGDFDTLVNESSDYYTTLKTEYLKKTSANYALLGDGAVALAKSTINITQYETQHDKKIAELYRSYVKVLTDQRVDYYVVIGRASWCEGDYCGNGNENNYPATQVDKHVFEYFDTLQESTIAKYRSSWGRANFTLNIPKDKWNLLKINYKSGLPSSHNYADYWLQSSYSKTYHKYTEIVNDTMTEMPWVAVSEDNFWNNYENLGMAIISKPYGYYEEDQIKDAQPVGMATVAKPVLKNGIASGSNQYGEWRHSNGNSFWHYYGMYRLFGALSGSRRYSYSDWNGYSGRSRGRPYYGRNQEYGTYGANTYSSGRYRNSSFARRNPGEVRSATSGTARSSRSQPSVRGAGTSSRSRGPSGGGK